MEACKYINQRFLFPRSAKTGTRTNAKTGVEILGSKTSFSSQHLKKFFQLGGFFNNSYKITLMHKNNLLNSIALGDLRSRIFKVTKL